MIRLGISIFIETLKKNSMLLRNSWQELTRHVFHWHSKKTSTSIGPRAHNTAWVQIRGSCRTPQHKCSDVTDWLLTDRPWEAKLSQKAFRSNLLFLMLCLVMEQVVAKRNVWLQAGSQLPWDVPLAHVGWVWHLVPWVSAAALPNCNRAGQQCICIWHYLGLMVSGEYWVQTQC